jgi:hypothetical protein
MIRRHLAPGEVYVRAERKEDHTLDKLFYGLHSLIVEITVLVLLVKECYTLIKIK